MEKGFDLEDEAQFVGEFPRKAYKWDNLYGYTWPDRNDEDETGLKFMIMMVIWYRKLTCIHMMI